VFKRSLLESALKQNEEWGFDPTDDAAMLERVGHPVCVVESTQSNLKITTPEDLRLARAFLKAKNEPGAMA
jgi:2-C-methyl-D-erythritol 4-phosphate cytidylyltransferase